MINNFEIIAKNLMWIFPEKITPDLFWTVYLSTEEGIWFKKYYFKSQSDLLKKQDEIVNICDKMNFKAFISLVPSSIKDTTLKIMSSIAANVANHEFLPNPWDLPDMFKEPTGVDKYVIYINKEDGIDIKQLINIVNITKSSRIKNGCKFEYDNPGMHYIKYTGEDTDFVYDNAITVLNTHTGYAIVMYDFDEEEFDNNCKTVFNKIFPRSKNTIIPLYAR